MHHDESMHDDGYHEPSQTVCSQFETQGGIQAVIAKLAVLRIRCREVAGKLCHRKWVGFGSSQFWDHLAQPVHKMGGCHVVARSTKIQAGQGPLRSTLR